MHNVKIQWVWVPKVHLFWFSPNFFEFFCVWYQLAKYWDFMSIAVFACVSSYWACCFPFFFQERKVLNCVVGLAILNFCLLCFWNFFVLPWFSCGREKWSGACVAFVFLFSRDTFRQFGKVRYPMCFLNLKRKISELFYGNVRVFWTSLWQARNDFVETFLRLKLFRQEIISKNKLEKLSKSYHQYHAHTLDAKVSGIGAKPTPPDSILVQEVFGTFLV